MTGSYQRRVERNLRDGKVAVVDMGRKRTGYIYHREGRYWMVTRRGDDYDGGERPCPVHKRDCLFDRHAVRAVHSASVPGPVSALAREPDDEQVAVDGGQRRLDDY